MAWLAACAPDRETLADDRRPLGVVVVGEHRLEVEASRRAWRYGAGWDGGPSLPHEDWYVGFTVRAEEGLVRGDVDETWSLAGPEAAEQAWSGLALAWCATGDRAAYRALGPAGAGTPWRLWVPDLAGGAGEVVPGAPAGCEAALASVDDADDWRSHHAAHPSVCAHLAHLTRRDDALRCHLREPARPSGRPASRQGLPGAPDDPGFDERLSRVLTESPWDRTAGFVPYRVLGLVAEVADRAAVQNTARALVARPEPALPWEAALVAAAAAESGDEALAIALEARLGCADAAGVAAARVAANGLEARWPTRAADHEPTAPWLPPGSDTGPPCPAEHRDAPDRCP